MPIYLKFGPNKLSHKIQINECYLFGYAPGVLRFGTGQYQTWTTGLEQTVRVVRLEGPGLQACPYQPQQFFILPRST